MENQKAPTHPLGTFLEVIGYVSAIVAGIILVFMLMSSDARWPIASAGVLSGFIVAGMGVIINALTQIVARLSVESARARSAASE